jgi:hypothetical protein
MKRMSGSDFWNISEPFFDVCRNQKLIRHSCLLFVWETVIIFSFVLKYISVFISVFFSVSNIL